MPDRPLSRQGRRAARPSRRRRRSLAVTLAGAAVALLLAGCFPQGYGPHGPPEPGANWYPGHTVWDDLAGCESGHDWGYNGPSGFDGGVQFLPSTWTNSGGGQFAPYAFMASRHAQITVAERVLAHSGWGAWPSCSSQLGLR